MDTRVFAVRIGEKYGQDVEDYINSKVPNVAWIREPFDPRVKLQWNKLYPMSLDIDEPVCVIDIDMGFVGDYMDVFNYPIKRGEYIAAQAWWQESDMPQYKLQGGFQKYYPKDCRYIFDKFMTDPEYWMEYYIKNGTTIGPVNGEQYFIQDTVNERLKLKYLPETWLTRWESWAHHDLDWLANANYHYPGEYLYLGEFNPDVRLLHFQGSNKPHKATLEALGW